MKKAMKWLLKLILSLSVAAAVAVTAFWFRYPPAKVDTKEAAAEITDTGSPYKYYFSQLGNEEKHAYNLILGEIYSMPESIVINRITSEQADRVFSALLNDNPDLFFIGRRCSIVTNAFQTAFSVEYSVTKDEYAVMKAELDEVCNGVIASLSDPEDDWQTELEIHDYIVGNCEYTLSENGGMQSTAYGALVEGSAACEGYSKAAKMLFDLVGIRSGVVSGTAKNDDGEMSPHMWNAVEINGTFYHLDCTWDDPVSDDGSENKTYFYFNVDDENMSITHSDFSYNFNCMGRSENYFVKTGAYFDSYDGDCRDRIVQIIVDGVEAGNDTVYLRFADEASYDAAFEDLIENEGIYGLLSEAAELTEVEFSTTQTGYFEQRERLIIAFAPNYE